MTSTKNWQKRLGKNWVKLHKLVYIISILGLVHFIWLKKLGIVAIWPYALILFILFGERFGFFGKKQQLKHTKTLN
jgi:sulfoxide reductase heme-binding subunit YedZ